MRAIAVSTLKEAVRKKTFIVMGLVTVLYLILWTILLYYFQNSSTSGGEVQFQALASNLVTQMGLQFSSMLLCLLTIILGAGAIAAELETGMIHAMLSRPLGRAEYVLGKLLGLSVLVFLYASVLYAALLCIGGMFVLSTVISLSVIQILKGWLVYALVPLTVLCLTLYGSVSMRVVPNGLLMIFIFVLGNISGVIEMIGNYIDSKAVISTGILISLISPFHTLSNTAERILLPSAGLQGDLLKGLGGLAGSGRPASAVMYIYIAVYALGFLVLAIRKFKRTDIP